MNNFETNPGTKYPETDRVESAWFLLSNGCMLVLTHNSHSPDLRPCLMVFPNIYIYIYIHIVYIYIIYMYALPVSRDYQKHQVFDLSPWKGRSVVRPEVLPPQSGAHAASVVGLLRASWLDHGGRRDPTSFSRTISKFGWRMSTVAHCWIFLA